MFLQRSRLANSSVYVVGDPYNSSFRSSASLIDSQAKVSLVINYWAKYCFDPSVCGAFAGADLQRSPYRYQFLENSGKLLNVSLGNAFWSVVDSSFGLQKDGAAPRLQARALRSEFFFGSPQRKSDGSLYSLDASSVQQMRSELGKWLEESGIHAMLLDSNEGTATTNPGKGDKFAKGTKLWWSFNNGLDEAYSNYWLFRDGSLAMGAILFIFCYVWFMTGSLFYSSAAISMILANFLPAILLYRFLGGYNYFGVLNVLAIFIILGIGVDDVFVLLDTWNATRKEHPGLKVSAIMSITLKHAGK